MTFVCNKDSIELAIDKRIRKEMTENNKNIETIIDTIILCERQEIPRKVHIEYDRLNFSES